MSEPEDARSLEAVHRALTLNWEAALALGERLPNDLSADTAYAIGQAAGLLAKAMALVGRDIDQRSTPAAKLVRTCT